MSCLTHPSGLTSHRTESRPRRDPVRTPSQARTYRNGLILEMHQGSHRFPATPVPDLARMFRLKERSVYDAIDDAEAVARAIKEVADAED